MADNAKTRQVSIRLDDDTDDRLRAEAERQRRPYTQLIRVILDEYVAGLR